MENRTGEDGEKSAYKSPTKEINKQSWDQINSYMQSRDIPEWFRGTSNFQVTAANNLFEALLFDIEQHTTHRVRACLTGLGLKPMITTEHMRVLMKLSQGSDLAFLWFLLELHYKSKGPGYTVNEQLILSTIAHLDMVTTLRELDRILPVNRNPEPKKEVKKQPRVVVTSDAVKKQDIPETSPSPYYETVKTPKIYKNKTTLKRPDMKVTMGEYEVWADPNYIVRNESNRWFADYKPRPARRVVHNILKEEINRIFEDSENIAERSDNPNIVCEYHRRLLEAERNLKIELQMIAREQCERYFDVDAQKQEKTRARIKAQLEQDVEMFMTKFRGYAGKVPPCRKGAKPQIKILLGANTVKHCPMSSDEEDCDCENQNNVHIDGEPRTSTKHEDCNVCFNEECTGSSESDESYECKKMGGNKRYSISCIHLDDCERLLNKGHTTPHKNGGGNGNNGGNGRPNAKSAKSKSASCDDGDTLSVEYSPSRRFFAAATEHQPWFFEYHRIFDMKHPLIPEKLNVKQACAEALDSEMSITTKRRGALKPDTDKALNKGFKKDWSKAVKQYNLEHETSVCEELMRKEQLEIDGEEVPLKFDREYFDPNDRSYLLYMLKRAFDFMKRKPKFVLAALPDAYKLPSFIYFIQNRYGKRYSPEERQRLYLESLHILRALEKLTKRVPMPKMRLFCKSPFVSYSCRDYLLEKGAKIRQQYYDQLDEVIMQQARVFWFSMRPYLCSSGPPRNTYFAYMPSRSIDITRFRQWKSSEFMNAKGEWDRRMRMRSNF